MAAIGDTVLWRRVVGADVIPAIVVKINGDATLALFGFSAGPHGVVGLGAPGVAEAADPGDPNSLGWSARA